MYTWIWESGGGLVGVEGSTEGRCLSPERTRTSLKKEGRSAHVLLLHAGNYQEGGISCWRDWVVFDGGVHCQEGCQPLSRWMHGVYLGAASADCSGYSYSAGQLNWSPNCWEQDLRLQRIVLVHHRSSQAWQLQQGFPYGYASFRRKNLSLCFLVVKDSTKQVRKISINWSDHTYMFSLVRKGDLLAIYWDWIEDGVVAVISGN